MLHCGLEADFRHYGLNPRLSLTEFFQDFHVRCSWAFRIFDCDNSKSIDVTEFGASVKVCTHSICQSRFLFSMFPHKVFKDFSTGGLEDFWRSWWVRHYWGSGPDCWRPCWHLRVSWHHFIVVWYKTLMTIACKFKLLKPGMVRSWWYFVWTMDRVANSWLGYDCHSSESDEFLSKTIDHSIVPKFYHQRFWSQKRR